MKKHVLTALLLCLALCLPVLVAAEDAKPILDIVWLIDTTNSMIQNGNIKSINGQLESFHNVLKDAYDVQVWADGIWRYCGK